MVFDGPEDYHARIDDPALELEENTVLVIRGVGPIGYPGAGEVVNMRAPDYLLKRGITELACVGDGRQSGTSGSPSILNASPEAATGGGLALLQTGDRVRVDIEERNSASRLDNGLGDGGADSTCRSGDENRLAVERVGAHQWLSRGRPFSAMRWYFTAGFSTMPSDNSETRPR